MPDINACTQMHRVCIGNKQEALEICACLQSYDLIGIREMWWGGSQDWNVEMEGYGFFRKDRQGRQGEDVTIYMYVSDELE